MGEDRQTARIYGIKSTGLKITMFAVSALAAAIGGILISSRVSYADTAIGVGLEFRLSQQRFLETASLYGGKGRVFLVGASA